MSQISSYSKTDYYIEHIEKMKEVYSDFFPMSTKCELRERSAVRPSVR